IKHFTERIGGAAFFKVAAQAIVRTYMHPGSSHKVFRKERRVTRPDGKQRYFVQIPVARRQRNVEQKPAAWPCRGNVGVNAAAIPVPHCRSGTGETAPAKLRQVAVITRKELVAAVAGQRDGHMLSSQTANVVRRYYGRVPERLFHDAAYVVDC